MREKLDNQFQRANINLSVLNQFKAFISSILVGLHLVSPYVHVSRSQEAPLALNTRQPLHFPQQSPLTNLKALILREVITF